MMIKRVIFFGLISMMGLAMIGTAVRSDDAASKFLDDFFKNPKRLMDEKPSRDYSEAPEFEKQKEDSSQTYRDWVIGRSKQQIEPGEKRAYFDADRPSLILGEKFENRLFNLPTKGKAKTQMGWSNDYWPIAFGSLSMRYVLSRSYDSYREAFNSYKQPHDYEMALKHNGHQPLNEIFSDNWSPAEKYDLLVGDTEFTLTKMLKEEGTGYSDAKIDQDTQTIVSLTKDVPLWMGKCHGWAAASTVVPRVDRDITLRGANGDLVHFHPDDIRGLITLKWAQSRFETLYVGGRCNKSLKKGEIQRDPDSGAIYDNDCFDVNPATFHTVITNQLGIRKKSIVMDATFDDEVWNHPIRQFRIVKFFNPETRKTYDTAKAALVAYDFKRDPFKKLRETKWEEAHRVSKQWIDYKNRTGNEFRPTSVVGVVMEVIYLVETKPRHEKPRPDQLVKVTYYYDVELDESGSLVGGEWYTNRHPDFLWGVGENTHPLNSVDIAISQQLGLTYDGTAESLKKIAAQKIPDGYSGNLFKLSSSYNQAPVATVVDYLIEKTK